MEGQPRWTGVFVVKTGLRAVPWTVVAEEWLSMEYWRLAIVCIDHEYHGGKRELGIEVQLVPEVDVKE